MTGTFQSKCFIQSQCVYATLKIVYDIESWLFFAETLARLGLSLAPTPSNSSAGSSKSGSGSAHFVCKVLRKSLGQTGRNSLRSKSDNCLHRLAGSPSPSPGTNTAKTCLAVVTDGQCDQIGQFIVIWETFDINHLTQIATFLGNLLKVSKSFIFLVKSVLGHSLQTFGNFLLVTLTLNQE